MPDPWAVLGLAPGATVAEARAARRRLAKQLHPDLHAGRSADERAELARRMTAVNLALAELLDPAGPDTAAPAADRSSGAAPAADRSSREAPAADPSSGAAAGPAGPDRPGTRAGVPGATGGSGASGVAGGAAGPDRVSSPRAGDHVHPAAAPLDADTIAVEALPAEAFEALFLVAYGLGEILVADEPYLLELYLAEPAPCFCRLTLVPVAGGSIVTLEVEPAEDTEPPPVEAVRDLLVAELDDLAGATPR